jgi:hypothetical protein
MSKGKSTRRAGESQIVDAGEKNSAAGSTTLGSLTDTWRRLVGRASPSVRFCPLSFASPASDNNNCFCLTRCHLQHMPASPTNTEKNKEIGLASLNALLEHRARHNCSADSIRVSYNTPVLFLDVTPWLSLTPSCLLPAYFPVFSSTVTTQDFSRVL